VRKFLRTPHETEPVITRLAERLQMQRHLVDAGRVRRTVEGRLEARRLGPSFRIRNGRRQRDPLRRSQFEAHAYVRVRQEWSDKHIVPQRQVQELRAFVVREDVSIKRPRTVQFPADEDQLPVQQHLLVDPLRQRHHAAFAETRLDGVHVDRKQRADLPVSPVPPLGFGVQQQLTALPQAQFCRVERHRQVSRTGIPQPIVGTATAVGILLDDLRNTDVHLDAAFGKILLKAFPLPEDLVKAGDPHRHRRTRLRLGTFRRLSLGPCGCGNPRHQRKRD